MLNRRRKAERGAVAIVTAISISAFLLVVSAMVVDLGLLRVDRQTDKSAADAAALAGVNGLVPNINSPVLHPFAGVCQALAYLRANGSNLATITGSWSDGSGTAVTAPNCSNPADPQMAGVCQPNVRSTWARFTGTTADGRTSVAIQSGYDVAGDSLDDLSGGRFPDENLPAYQGDTGTPAAPGATDYKGCENLAVILGDVRNTKLGVQAVKQMHTRIRSVARVTISPPVSPYALLILERKDCQAILNGSVGSTNRIDVQGYKSHPGMIHVDSDGSGLNCNKPIIVGNNPGTCPDPPAPLTPTCGGVVAHEAPDTHEPGQITVTAASNRSDATPMTYAGPYPGTSPTYANLVTRQVLDDVYLQGVTNAVSAAKNVFASAAAGAPAGYTPVTTCPAGVTTGAGSTITSAATNVYVTCADNKSVYFPNATNVIFSGQVAGDIIRMPKATNVYVFGVANPAAISVGTQFSMNGNDAACPSSYTPAANRARLFVNNGALKANGGLFRACNTTVILMGNATDGGACLPSLSPYVATYTNTPCPGNQTGNGEVNMGGNTNIDWTAPNLDDDEVPAPAADHLLLEDLALWTETYSAGQGLGGTGSMHLSGVFAAPNADPFTLNGGGTQNVKNSQYVVRKLRTTGGGTLTMQPLPSLPVAPPSVTFGLVR